MWGDSLLKIDNVYTAQTCVSDMCNRWHKKVCSSSLVPRLLKLVFMCHSNTYLTRLCVKNVSNFFSVHDLNVLFAWKKHYALCFVCVFSRYGTEHVLDNSDESNFAICLHFAV